MNIPKELKYTQDHIWVQEQNKKVFRVGITDFAQSQLGDIVYVEVETENENLLKNQVFGTIEAVKTVSDLFLPLDGKVIAFNKQLEDEPELVNTDPYGRGWIIELEISDLSQLEKLLTAQEYKEIESDTKV